MSAKLTAYKIQQGDNFYLLSKRLGVGLDQVINANPGLEADKLAVGQVVSLPGALPKGNIKSRPGTNIYEDSLEEGEMFSGKNLDEVGVNLGGADFQLRRIINNEVPHEIHIILPRTEIHSITRDPNCILTETQIMISNIDIIHSPRQ